MRETADPAMVPRLIGKSISGEQKAQSSNRQLRLRKILRRLYRCGANLLHCRSPLSLALQSASITWERTASRRRPAFSLENNCGKRWVKQLPSALELPCARVVGAASPSTALARRSECD